MDFFKKNFGSDWGAIFFCQFLTHCCTSSTAATAAAASEALALENATVPHRWPPSSVSTHRVVASNFAEKSVGVVGPLGEHGHHIAASATSEASSLSCFGALCSVVRAATDYCRYGNLKQYLLIDPNTGEPLKDTIYTASHLTTEVFSDGVGYIPEIQFKIPLKNSWLKKCNFEQSIKISSFFFKFPYRGKKA